MMTMLPLVAVTTGLSRAELLTVLAGIVGLLVIAGWYLLKKAILTPPQPDPWDETIAAEIEKPEATPLCHHCLHPHSGATDFCSDCGTPVGQYTNWLPFPQLFSIGHVLRTGTSGEFKRTPVTILGFMLFSLAEYTLFAPIYWVIFLRKLSNQQLPKKPSLDSAPAQQP